MWALPDKKYGVIYADPPWNFLTYSVKGRGRCADAWYDVMSFNDIKALPVASIADNNCILLLWTTDSFLGGAMDVIKAWGFEFKTVGFYWVKRNNNGVYPIGLGYYTRSNPEQCLLARRGNPKRISAAVRKLIISPRREHSRKPDETYDRIEALLPGPYIELFARNSRDGWDAWGNELEEGIRSKRRYRSDLSDK